MPPHAIHGTAYRRPWHVGRRRRRRDVDELRPGVGARRPRLAADRGRRHAVTCELGVVAGDRAMPAEIGWHPWFVKPRVVVVPADVDVRPRRRGDPERASWCAPPPGPWDDCFVNTEPVELHYADLTVTVTSDCDHWVVYDEPPARDVRRAPIGPTRRVQPASTGARARRTAGPDDDDSPGTTRGPSIGVARSGDNALRIARPSAPSRSGRARRRRWLMTTTYDDAHLVATHLAGDPAALAAIYDRFSDSLYDTAAAMLGDRQRCRRHRPGRVRHRRRTARPAARSDAPEAMAVRDHAQRGLPAHQAAPPGRRHRLLGAGC